MIKNYWQKGKKQKTITIVSGLILLIALFVLRRRSGWAKPKGECWFVLPLTYFGSSHSNPTAIIENPYCFCPYMCSPYVFRVACQELLSFVREESYHDDRRRGSCWRTGCWYKNWHIYIYIYPTYLNLCIHRPIYLYLYIYIHTDLHTYIHTYIHTHMCITLYICMCICMYVCIRTHIVVYSHRCVYVYIWLCWWFKLVKLQCAV